MSTKINQKIIKTINAYIKDNEISKFFYEVYMMDNDEKNTCFINIFTH